MFAIGILRRGEELEVSNNYLRLLTTSLRLLSFIKWRERMLKTANISDVTMITKLALLLWPSHEFDELKIEIADIILDENSMIVLYLDNNNPVGFAQCQLRYDYVEGTKSSPVGYLEGIFVDEKYRMQGIAKQLIKYCETWAKGKGCTEFASDCELTNTDSLHFHLKLGFIEANRIICFNKKI